MTLQYANENDSKDTSQSSEYMSLLELRIVVGYLGETAQFGWWDSAFFSATSDSFLAPVFPRTRFLSQAEGVKAAACKLHDSRIGVGKVFHLFRLPEGLEQAFHRLLHDSNVCDELGKRIASKETAIEFLQSNFTAKTDGSIGPVSVGNVHHATDKATIDAIGQQYLHGFTSETPVFPFLKEG